jgi:hypothetical protein
VAHLPDEEDPRPSDVGQWVVDSGARLEPIGVDAQWHNVDALAVWLQPTHVAHERARDEDACRPPENGLGQRREQSCQARVADDVTVDGNDEWARSASQHPGDLRGRPWIVKMHDRSRGSVQRQRQERRKRCRGNGERRKATSDKHLAPLLNAGGMLGPGADHLAADSLLAEEAGQKIDMPFDPTQNRRVALVEVDDTSPHAR